MKNECTLTGSGKYLLLSQKVGGIEQFSILGGPEFEMHKDIYTAMSANNHGVVVHGGGRVDITEKEIVFSGASQKYGKVKFPEKVRDIATRGYPGFNVLIVE